MADFQNTWIQDQEDCENVCRNGGTTLTELTERFDETTVNTILMAFKKCKYTATRLGYSVNAISLDGTDTSFIFTLKNKNDVEKCYGFYQWAYGDDPKITDEVDCGRSYSSAGLYGTFGMQTTDDDSVIFYVKFAEV